MPGYSQNDNSTYAEHHNTNSLNEIDTRRIDADGGGAGSTVTETLSFGPAGNLVANYGNDGSAGDDIEYLYDAFNRVTWVKNNDASVPDVQYAHDALGRRAYREVNGEAEVYFYDGHRIVAKEFADGSMEEYVYGLDYIDEPLAIYRDQNDSVTQHFVLQDANYNVVAVTTDDGALVQQYRNEPYGLRTAVEDANGNSITDESLVLVPQGIHGHWWDPVTRLYHMRNRDLSPELQRALQRDPNGTALAPIFPGTFAGQAPEPNPDYAPYTFHPEMQYSDGPNVYQFMLSNPIRNTDPFGTFTLLGLAKSTGIRAWQAYEVADAALSAKQFFGLIIEAISSRNMSLDPMSEMAATAGDFGLSFLTGPGLDVFQRFAKAGKRGHKAGKVSMKGLATIAEQRRRARQIMREVMEDGLDQAKKEWHHMVPRQLLKELCDDFPDVYKGVVGVAGNPNRFRIPRKLHTWMHSDRIAGPGGWWNEIWLDAFDDMKTRNLSARRMADELKMIREVALHELGILDMLP